MYEYNWLKSVWKGLRPAIIVAAASAVVAFVGAIDVPTLVSVGIPQILAVFIVESLRNYFKQHMV